MPFILITNQSSYNKYDPCEIDRVSRKVEVIENENNKNVLKKEEDDDNDYGEEEDNDDNDDNEEEEDDDEVEVVEIKEKEESDTIQPVKRMIENNSEEENKKRKIEEKKKKYLQKYKITNKPTTQKINLIINNIKSDNIHNETEFIFSDDEEITDKNEEIIPGYDPSKDLTKRNNSLF